MALTDHPADSLASGTAAFGYSSETPGVAYLCRLGPWEGAGTWEPCDTGGVTYSGLSEGRYLFEVVAWDQGDNTLSDPVAAWPFRVDVAGPAAIFAETPPSHSSVGKATFRFSLDEETQGGIRCAVDGRSPSDCSNGTFRADGIGNGDHVFSVVSTDRLGNRGETQYAWTVDTVAPKAIFMGWPPKFSPDRIARFDLWADADPALFLCRTRWLRTDAVLHSG